MSIADYRKRLEERAKANEESFDGKYRDEINALMGLSKDEIDQITPDATDLKIYAQLISIVKEASAANVDMAEMKKDIIALGEVGVSIAKMVPQLAVLFI